MCRRDRRRTLLLVSPVGLIECVPLTWMLFRNEEENQIIVCPRVCYGGDDRNEHARVMFVNHRIIT